MSSDKPVVTVVGSYNHDMSVTVPSIPVPGETVVGEDFEESAGGKGSNQAVAAARTGGDVSFVGAIGDDRFGESAREMWDAEGIDASAVHEVDAPTGVALIHVAEDGENAIAVGSGANADLDGETVRAASDRIEASDVLLTQLETSNESVAAGVDVAADAGVEVILDPAPARELPEDLLENADIVTPNETEVRVLAGYDADGDVDEVDAARDLLDRGPDAVVLTLGAEGAKVVTGDGIEEVDAVETDVVDTTGAGDAFNGAFAVARGDGESLRTATRWGVAAGALACTERGVVPSLPDRDAIEEVLG